MISRATHTETTVADQFFEVAQRLASSVTQVSIKEVAESWLTLRRLLDSLPAPTAQFDLAVLRLANFQRYMQSNERGAAAYEIRLLLGAIGDLVAPHLAAMGPAAMDPATPDSAAKDECLRSVPRSRTLVAGSG